MHIVVSGRDEPWTEWMISPSPSVPKIYYSREITSGPLARARVYRLSQKDVTRPTTRPRNRKPADALSRFVSPPRLRDPLTSRCRACMRYAYGEIYCQPKNARTRELYCTRVSAFCICTIMMNNIMNIWMRNTSTIPESHGFRSLVSFLEGCASNKVILSRALLLRK